VREQREKLVREQSEAEAEKAKAKTVITSSNPGRTREQELQNEVDKCMVILKCSTCKMRMRNTVITKCMHCMSLALAMPPDELLTRAFNQCTAFCKECVDARIQTRQRKCPACNLQFAQTDVQTLFFQ
jgi:E3 ubiquitin-protein ligase BRE1